MAIFVLVHGGGHDGRVWDIDTGHDLTITEPEKVSGHLLRVAAL